MPHATTLFVGVDVHQDSHAVAYVSDARESEVVFLGRIGTRQCDRDKRIRTLTSNAQRLVLVYEAGPGGYWRDRYLTKKKLTCWVVPPLWSRRRQATASTPIDAMLSSWPGACAPAI